MWSRYVKASQIAAPIFLKKVCMKIIIVNNRESNRWNPLSTQAQIGPVQQISIENGSSMVHPTKAYFAS